MRKIIDVLPPGMDAGKFNYVSVWNEPNYPTQPSNVRSVNNGAETVAKYTKWLNSLCLAKNSCQIVSPEMAQTSTWTRWLKSYIEKLRTGTDPKFWGFHPHVDVERGVKVERALCYQRALAAGEAQKRTCPYRRAQSGRFRDMVRAGGHSDRKVWFSEAGSRMDKKNESRTKPNTQLAQSKEVDYLMRYLARYADTVLYYHWWEPRESAPASTGIKPIWDSGLLQSGPDFTKGRCFAPDPAHPEGSSFFVPNGDPTPAAPAGEVKRIHCAQKRAAYDTYKSFVNP
jgi:hypothetical protein